MKWLERSLMIGPYLTLCTTPKEFRAVLKHLKCEDDVPFHGSDGAAATTHTLYNGESMTCAVTIRTKALRENSKAAIAALMAHEAVHIWRAYCEWIGEDEPASEQEAYAVQHITYELTAEAFRRRKRGG